MFERIPPEGLPIIRPRPWPKPPPPDPLPDVWVIGNTNLFAIMEDAPRNIIVAALSEYLDGAMKDRFGPMCFCTQDYMVDPSKVPSEATPAISLWEARETGGPSEMGVPVDRVYLEVILYIWVKNKATGTEVQRTLNRVTNYLKRVLWNVSSLGRYRVEILRRGTEIFTHSDKNNGAVTMTFTVQYDLPIAF